MLFAHRFFSIKEDISNNGPIPRQCLSDAKEHFQIRRADFDEKRHNQSKLAVVLAILNLENASVAMLNINRAL